MHPCHHSATHPDRIAMVIADTAETLTYRDLEDGSNRAAQMFRSLGLVAGDKIAVMLKNGLDYPVVYWGAQRSGLYATVISTHLTADEVAYILRDSGARLLVTSADIGATAITLAADHARLAPGVMAVYSTGAEPLPGAASLDGALAAMPATRIADEVSGFYLIYSSGTTGKPKGIVLPFSPGPIDEIPTAEGSTFIYAGFDPLIAFNGGPLYHGAPLGAMIACHRLGGTCVSLRRFDAVATLKAIQDWGVVNAQFVPTMFVRMLALPEQVRAAYDLSSLRYVSHAAAPCPVEIKRRMIDWLGPIVNEYYGSSEAIGGTYITSAEWLAHPGSVGRSQLAPVHICAEDGTELPPRATGIIYFEVPGGRDFQYLNDAEKTAKGRHPLHPDWYSVGDIGWLDEEDYLYLTDRQNFMIISGGVNIYPQAVEDALIVHPRVLDAAVIGVPHPDFGEEVLAIVQPRDPADAGDALRDDLNAWCRARISGVSCPRAYRFVADLPRLQSGKLAKHELRRIYGTPGPAVRTMATEG